MLEAALDIAKRFEGLHRVGTDGLIYPYICPAGFPTIGYGRLVASLTHPPITRATAEAWLIEDMEKAAMATVRLVPALIGEPPERISAIADFVYNLGSGRLQTSTLRRRLADRDWPEAARELRRWVYGGGKILPGLVARREAEAALLLA